MAKVLIAGCGTGHDWSIPEARAHKLAFIREICDHYDLAGFELDFMRFPFFFREQVPAAERVRNDIRRQWRDGRLSGYRPTIADVMV